MKKSLFILGLAVCGQIFGASSHWNEEQVAKYVHYSDLQRRSTWHLLSQIKFNGDESILDVGCGDGRNSAWMAWLVPKGSVLGVDPSKGMISWAAKQYPSFEFPNLTFVEGDAHCLPEATSFDIITSFFSLHIPKEKKSAVQLFYDRLAPGGKLLCVLPPPMDSNPTYTKALIETRNSPTWTSYFEGFQTTFNFVTKNDYEHYLKAAGFEIEKAEYIPTIDPFININEFIHWFEGTMPDIHRLPTDLRKPFIEEVVEKYIEKRPEALSEDGVISFYWGFFEIVAKKPAQSS